MSKRWIVIGSSFVAALAVLGLTLLLGPSTPSESEEARPAGPPPAATPRADAEADGQAEALAEDQAEARLDVAPAPPFNPDEVIERELLTESQVFDDVGGGYTLVEGDRRVLMTWDRLTPRPQGVSDVTEPNAWVFLDERRVLRIAGNEGTLVAPRNEPREGAVAGDVTVTLYDARDHERVDLETLRDVRMRVHLDNAEFDLELGHIESDGPVRLEGRHVEFRGRGLSLTFNELRSRIERLEIVEGESLRFRPETADEAGEPSEPATARLQTRQEATGLRLASAAGLTPHGIHLVSDENREATEAQADPQTPAEAPPQQDEQPAEDDEPTQFYHATFHDAVRVSVGPERMEMTADDLEAIFSLEADPGAATGEAQGQAQGQGQGQGQTQDESRSRRRPHHAPPRAADATPAPPILRTGAAPAPPEAAPGPELDLDTDAEGDRSLTAPLFTPAAEDVIVHWTGPLLVLPIESPPSELAGPEDMLLTLTGGPALARTGDAETIEGRSIDYLTSTGRLRVHGSAEHRVRLRGPRLGTLTGESLLIEQQLGTGHLTGPGTLVAPLNGGEGSEAEEADEADEAEKADDELRIAWADRLDLTFYHQRPTRAEAADARQGGASTGPGAPSGADRASTAATPRIRALRSAAFHGEVEASHPQFDLGTDRLDAHLSEPGAEESGVLERIDALGAVVLTARPENEPPLDLDAEELTIHLDSDAGETPRPSRILAAGSVHTRQPGQRARAERLQLDFAHADLSAEAGLGETGDAEASEETSPAAAAAAQGLERMTATGDVHIELDDPATELFGQRMVADITADQLELFGEAEPARDAAHAAAGDAPLARVMRDDGILAGRHIIMRQADRAVRVRGPGWFDAQMTGDAPADALRVTWAEAMEYDDDTGRARFQGGVRADTRDAEARARLTTDDLQLQLAEADPSDTPPVNDADAQTPHPEPQTPAPDTPTRRIQTATARGESRFIAEQIDPTSNVLLTRLRLDGELMTFDGEHEQVQVVGAGRMLIQDQRPTEADAEVDAEAEGPLPGVRLSGRGETLFLWQEQFTFDVAANEVLMEEAVQMIHEPAAEGATAQFDARRMLTRFAETGGLAGWGSADAPEPVVEMIRAAGAVRILHGGRRITSDHLQYTRHDQRVRLWGDAGRVVRLARDDQPSALSAEQVIWDLARDRFEATDLGPGLVPIPE